MSQPSSTSGQHGRKDEERESYKSELRRRLGMALKPEDITNPGNVDDSLENNKSTSDWC